VDQITELRQSVERRGGSLDEHLVFSDAEVSGGIWERSGLRALLLAVESGRVRRIFVEDLIIASAFSRELSDKTKRGLVGRAKLGLSTGGRTFGYRTEPETSANGQIIGHRRVVDETTAKTVRRIFQLYHEGLSLIAIAKQLNGDKVPPPRGDHPQRRSSGWVHTTVRAMLYNPIYSGVASYNEREWIKKPGTNSRRYRKRDAKELVTVVDPKLRIIDEVLWDAVQTRLEQTHAHYTKNQAGRDKGKAFAGRQTPYLFKLLKCGLCGSPMNISGGSSTRYYRCDAHNKRGTCSNALSVREDILRQKLLEELLHTLARPSGLAFARKCIAEGLGEIERTRRSKLTDLKERVDDIARRLDALVNFIADGHARSNGAALGAKGRRSRVREGRRRPSPPGRRAAVGGSGAPADTG
jgi:site-specific DNA recombinase